MGDEKGRKGHAIMISVPFQGHINPFLNLALNLASKGLTITFVHLEFVHDKLSKAHHANHSNSLDLFSDARESGLDIRYTTMSDGLPHEFDRDEAENYWITLFRTLPARADEFVGNIIQSEPLLVPNVLITDTIYAWSDNVARKYSLVHVSFWTEPALVFSLQYHLDLIREKGHFPCKDDEDLEIDYVPGVQAISTKDLMQNLKEDNDVTTTLLAAFEQVKRADFVLHNTVHELETETLSALNKYQPTYAVGPINFSSIDNTVSQSLKAGSDCTRWLDSRPPGSVLYVSFGSVVQTNKQVIQEIASGLLLSGVSFIWVARAGITGSAEDGAVFPDGFEDEIKDRGLIIPWCDQIRVLSHVGVGGFLTHCGWNSVIESMWSGVPMICHPIAYDQPTNRKLVVDEWKIGISLCDGPLLDRNDVSQKIMSFMNGAISKRLRQEANNVKHTIHNALQIGGSSYRNVDQFIKDLEEKLC